MKRNRFAVFQLASLHTLPKLLVLCVVLAVLQLGAFGWVLTHGATASFVEMLDNGHLGLLFRVVLVLVGVLSLSGCRGKSNLSYTLGRLRLPMYQIGLAWSVNTALCLVIVWGVEVVILMGCKSLFQAHIDPSCWSHQSFFIDCYRSDFLHGVLPMGDWVVWVRNVLAVAAVSVSSGSAWVNTWRGVQPKLPLFALVVLFFSFETAGSTLDYFISMVYAIVLVVGLDGLAHREEFL